MATKGEKMENTENVGLMVPDFDKDFLNTLGRGALDDLSTHDVVMPRYRLVQNTSRTGTPGKWVSNTNPELELDFLDIIIFKISNFRTLFPKVGEGDNKPQCRSNDGLRKANNDGIGDGNCQSCRYAVWSKDGNGKSIPPSCKAGYTVLGQVVLPGGLMEPAMISLKGSAIKPSKQFFTKMTTLGVPPFAYVTRIGSSAVSNEKGRFFVPTFDIAEYIKDKGQLLGLAEQVKQYAAFSNDAMADLGNDDSAPIRDSAATSFNDFSEFSDAQEATVIDTELPF